MQRFKFVAIFTTVLLCSANVLSKPLIVTTIKPIALIAHDIGGEDAEVRQLLPNNSSPHDYALKVSDRRLLSAADLAVWIGPSLEMFVEKIVSSNQNIIEWQEIEGITWPTIDASHDTHEHSEICTHGGLDPHLWLNPDNARLLASEIATWLQANDPHNHERYQKRLQKFTTELSKVDAHLEKQFANDDNRSKPFLVQHAAYDHFVNRYGLNQEGSLRTISGAKIGARTLYHLESGAESVNCLFTDPQFDARPTEVFSQRKSIRVIELDPLASQVSLTISSDDLADKGERTGYGDLLWYFSRQFERCFQSL